MTYTSDKRPLPETTEELRARIRGWGVDLDPAVRPSVPRLQLDPDRSGAHWDFPERQAEQWPRERSIEHAFLPRCSAPRVRAKASPASSVGTPTAGTAKPEPRTG